MPNSFCMVNCVLQTLHFHQRTDIRALTRSLSYFQMRCGDSLKPQQLRLVSLRSGFVLTHLSTRCDPLHGFPNCFFSFPQFWRNSDVRAQTCFTNSSCTSFATFANLKFLHATVVVALSVMFQLKDGPWSVKHCQANLARNCSRKSKRSPALHTTHTGMAMTMTLREVPFNNCQ